MKILVLLAFLIASFSAKELNKDEINPSSYAIQIATLTTKQNVNKLLKTLSKYDTFVSEKDKYFAVYVVELKTIEETKKELQNIKKRHPTAVIRKLTNLFNVDKKELITEDEKLTKPVIEPKLELEPIIAKVDDVNETIILDEDELKTESNDTKKPIVKFEPELIVAKIDNTNETIVLDEDELFKANRDSGFSLYESIIYSLSNNYKLKASNERIYQRREKIVENEAGHLPTIDISGNVGYEKRVIETGDVSSDPKTRTRLNYKKTELYLTIKENLWTGGKVESGINEQEHKLDAELFEHRNQIEIATINMIEAYFGVVYAEISVKISTYNMKSYEKILKIVKIKEENGASTKGDVNFIQANVDNAKTLLVNDQASLSNEMAKYAYYMQDVDENNLPYETETNIQTKDLDSSVDFMYHNNAILQRQQSYIKASSEFMKMKDANYYPVVDFMINAETKDEFDYGIGQRDKLSALMTFSYNLYKGGKDEAEYLSAYSKMKEQKYTYNDEKNKLEYEIKVLHRSTSSMEESLALTKNEVIAAKKVVDSYWIAFKHGTQDLQALQLAQRNLNRAQLDYVNYKKTFIINNFKLMQKTGELLKFLEINQNNI